MSIRRVVREVRTLTHCWWGCKMVEKRLAGLQKVRRIVILWPCNSTPRRVSKRIENIRPHKNVFTHVHSNIIRNSQKSGSDPPVHRLEEWTWTRVVCPHDGILSSREKERSTDTRYHIDTPGKLYAGWKKPDTEGHMLCDPHSFEGCRAGKSTGTERTSVAAGAGEWEASERWAICTVLLCRILPMFWNSIVLTVTQLCEQAENHWTVLSERVNFMVWRLSLSKKGKRQDSVNLSSVVKGCGVKNERVYLGLPEATLEKYDRNWNY